MIIIKQLNFDYWFSYGKNNSIDFTKEVLTQIKGKNGHGKSSIALILQEVFYGKNSKGIKKQDLLNRKFPKETLSAYVQFSDGHDEYEITLTRKSTLKLSFKKNGEDISSHTSTSTYKTIEAVLGMEFKTFAQLTYQSSVSSLQFLTATDTTRKNFLTSLFSLTKYTDFYEIFKEESRKLNKELGVQQGKVSTTQSWIERHENMDLTPMEEIEVPELGESLSETIATCDLELKNLESTNKKINANNEYIKMLGTIDLTPVSAPEETKYEDVAKINVEIGQLETEIKGYRSKIFENNQKIKEIQEGVPPENCSKCGQPWPEKVDESFIMGQIASINAESVELNDKIHAINLQIDDLSDRRLTAKKRKQHYEELLAKWDEYQKRTAEFERLTSLIDSEMPTEVLNKAELQQTRANAFIELKAAKEEISKAQKHNNEASAHNSKIKVIQEQLTEYRASIEDESGKMFDLEDTLDKVEILKKAFSSTGLITYKLEFLIKDLEKEINTYLLSFSDGKFQIDFNLKGEKLNIDILNNGLVVTIESLSDGERSRVNVSTLLAIRKMMSEISHTKINLLFLDEIMGVLDTDGKETLIEVLMKEELNTYLVSHEYEHPLVPAITVMKENEESRIETGS